MKMKIELLNPISVLSMSFHGNAIVPRHCSMVVTFIKKGVYSEITISIIVLWCEKDLVACKYCFIVWFVIASSDVSVKSWILYVCHYTFFVGQMLWAFKLFDMLHMYYFNDTYWNYYQLKLMCTFKDFNSKLSWNNKVNIKDIILQIVNRTTFTCTKTN
jgi:hypothetical protein